MLLYGLLSWALFLPLQAQNTDELKTVPHVDIKRYMGAWYEIGRLENPWEKECSHNVVAIYTLQADGTVRVINQCQTGPQPTDIHRVEGTAWVTDKTSNAKLKVSFVHVPLIKWIASGDYWIIQLADDYSYAVVSEPSQKYLWILSRTPSLPPDIYQKILRSIAYQAPKVNILHILPTKQDPLTELHF